MDCVFVEASSVLAKHHYRLSVMFNSIQEQNSFGNQLNTATPAGGADFSALQTQGMPLGNQQAGVGQTQQLNEICADPWANRSVDQLISNRFGGGSGATPVMVGVDAPNGATLNASNGDVLIQGGDTSNAEKSEVNDLLAQGHFNRNWNSHGKQTFVNRCTNIRGSAHENPGFGVTDSRDQAFDLGTVVYRQSKQVNGTIGYTMEGSRDRNDFFKFRVGKTGDYKLRLSGLTGDSGLALYKEDGTQIGISDRDGNLTENIRKRLTEGNYYARVYNYEQSPWEHDDNTNYRLNIWKVANGLERSLKNIIRDKSVENAALNAVKYDNAISRNDVIGVLKSAGDRGSVSGQEVGDLRRFWNRTDHLMRSDVKVLSKKVAFHDDSNEWYTGSDSIRDELGDLRGGTSRQDLHLLIGKHLLGTDRPAITRDNNSNLLGEYKEAQGSLFVGGLSHDDVDQGALGSCYFLSALQGAAHDKPNSIRNMFKDNGDGTFSVRFYTNGKTDYVTVDKSVAAWTGTNSFMYARSQPTGGSRVSTNSPSELWAALAEKAYAQVNESGRINQDGTNSYQGIGFGLANRAIKHVTGINTRRQIADPTGLVGVSQNELISYVNSSRVVNVGSFNGNASTDDDGDNSIDWKSTNSTNIGRAVQSHAYSVVGYNASTRRFDIRNPWGTANLSLRYNQLVQLGSWFSFSNS